MKNLYLFSVIFLLCLVSACGNDDDVAPITGNGLLVHLERALDDVFYEWTDITYDENQRVASIEIQLENFQNNTYEAEYQGDDIISLKLTVEYQNSGNVTEINYDLIVQGNEITLMPAAEGAKYVFNVTGDYIDSFKAFWGPNDGYYNETVFARDGNSNIGTVAYHVTDATSTDLKVYEYTFSDYASEFDFASNFNPVMDFSFAGYDAYLGAALGLKISNDPPMKSSYWDAGGTFREENITAAPLVDNGALQELSYQDAGTGSNNYLLKLSYD